MIPGQIHSRTATALAAVERALAELRRGGIVVLRDDDGAGGLVIAAEACGPRALQRLQGLAQAAPVLVTTRRRAEAIGMEIPPHIAGGMGETNILIDRLKRPTRRTVFARAAAIYQERFADAQGRLPATFQVLFLTGWAPDPYRRRRR